MKKSHDSAVVIPAWTGTSKNSEHYKRYIHKLYHAEKKNIDKQDSEMLTLSLCLVD